MKSMIKINLKTVVFFIFICFISSLQISKDNPIKLEKTSNDNEKSSISTKMISSQENPLNFLQKSKINSKKLSTISSKRTLVSSSTRTYYGHGGGGSFFGAILGFFFGFVVFFGTIYLIIWNERRAVAMYNLIDRINDPEKCVETRIEKPEDLDPSKIYLIAGKTILNQTAIIPDLNMETPNNILIRELLFEECFTHTETVTERDEGFFTTDETTNVYKEMRWKTSEDEKKLFFTKHFYGKVKFYTFYFNFI